jgi:homoserine dehydrogenase
MDFNVALLGFGHVGRALAELIMEKRSFLRQVFNLNVRVIGISTARHGHAIDSNALRLRTAIDAVQYGASLDGLHEGSPIETPEQFIETCPAALFFESIPTNPVDGQPALNYARLVLNGGRHYVTANKGPAAFGYQELKALAERCEAGFFFESTVMDGAPVLGVGREGLPGAEIRRIRGIFNSTTNYILTKMEQENVSFEEALSKAQSIGIAETDPSLDIDGWDAAIKTVILANVLMGCDLRPADVDRQGIRGLTLTDIKAAAQDGFRLRLICTAERIAENEVVTRVYPERVPSASTFGSITGTTSIVDFETDILPRLTIVEHDPGPRTTAYGMLADMINIARGRHRMGPIVPE